MALLSAAWRPSSSRLRPPLSLELFAYESVILPVSAMASAEPSLLIHRALPYEHNHVADRRGSRDQLVNGVISASSSLQARADAARDGGWRRAHRLRWQALSRFCKHDRSECARLRRRGNCAGDQRGIEH